MYENTKKVYLCGTEGVDTKYVEINSSAVVRNFNRLMYRPNSNKNI